MNHPSEGVTQGQKVQVKVLEINKDKQEISLGMKQLTPHPWDGGEARHHPPWDRALLHGQSLPAGDPHDGPGPR